MNLVSQLGSPRSIWFAALTRIVLRMVGHPVRTGAGHGPAIGVVLPRNVTAVEVVVWRMVVVWGWWEQGPLSHLKVSLVYTDIVTHGWTTGRARG